MTRTPRCRELEADLVASATGEATPVAAGVVDDHVRGCATCRGEFERYRAIGRLVGELGPAPVAEARLAELRQTLGSRLADLRRRAVVYGIFASPLGPMLIARTEEGVALVEYLPGRGRLEASRLSRRGDVEAREDEAEVAALYGDLIAYLGGERQRFAWPLDLRFVASDFHREVLAATAALPYGAVTSYAHLAREVGRPRAVRAVAQALRRNPVPIVVPCHRVVGSTGDLVGYAGNRVTLKQRLLALEGVPLTPHRREPRIARDTMYARADGEREYCLPTCGSLVSLSLARLTLFASRAGAEGAGLAPCTTCRPDLHALSR